MPLFCITREKFVGSLTLLLVKNNLTTNNNNNYNYNYIIIIYNNMTNGKAN